MPIIKSAKKRVRVASKAAVRNSKTKRSLKDTLKAVHRALTGKKDTKAVQRKAESALDTAAKKGVLHKNKAARKKSQLAKATKATKSTAAKPAAKKTVKKSTTKKK